MTTTTQIDDGTDLRYTAPFSLDDAIADYQANSVNCEQFAADIAHRKEILACLVEVEETTFRARDDKDYQYTRIHQLVRQARDSLKAREGCQGRIDRLLTVEAPEAALAGDRIKLVGIGKEILICQENMKSLDLYAQGWQAECAEMMGATVSSTDLYDLKPYEKEVGRQRAAAAASAGSARANREAQEGVIQQVEQQLAEAQARKDTALEAVVAKATALAPIVYENPNVPDMKLLEQLAAERSALES
jgi:hypothetical protein